MRVITYEAEWYEAVRSLVFEFHEEYVKEFDPEIREECVAQTIQTVTNANAGLVFLLLTDDDEPKGILGGIECDSRINKRRLFQEIIWYVRPQYGRCAVWFINRVAKQLREKGYHSMIMAVLDSEKAAKIKRIYELIGFRYLESHYTKDL